MATTHLMNTIKEVSRRTTDEAGSQATLLDVHKVYLKLIKQWPGKEKDLLGSMKELYAKMRGRPGTDADKIPAEEVVKFCAQEVAKQKAATSIKKKMAGSMLGRPPAAAGQLNNPGVSGSGTQQQQSVQQQQQQQQQQATVPQQQQQSSAALMEVLQQRAHILAYVAQMERFTADLAISSVSQLPASVVAGMVGLTWADQPRDLTALVSRLAALKPSQMARVGLSSTELGHILNFAKHFNVELGNLAVLLTNQKRYESELTKKFLAASRAGNFMGGSSSSMPPVKQTVPFKAKHEGSPHAVKKAVQQAVKNVLPTRSPVTSSSTAAEKSGPGTMSAVYNQLLGNSGITITKPRVVAADIRPTGATAEKATGATAPTPPAAAVMKGLDMKKFPHLTISSVDFSGKAASSGATTPTSSVAAPAVKTVPAVASSVATAAASRPLSVKSFASLHADSTNINTGVRANPVPAVSTTASSALSSLPQQISVSRTVVGGNRASFVGGGESAAKSPLSSKSGASAAYARKVTVMGQPPPATTAKGVTKSNEPKRGQGSSKSIAALRDFKAQASRFDNV
jgi:hypothetical protein